LLSAAIALLSLAALPAGASAQRLESFALPSTAGNVDVTKVELNNIDSLRATVMLPDGYDENPDQDWPVLYLLEGVGDNSEGWSGGAGQIQKTAKGLPAIVVMPESGRGFSMDWWAGGARSGPRWQRYFLDEVIPTIESRYRIKPGRQFHSIGGLSMGGYGAVLLGGQLPGYFGSIVSMSGLVDSQSPDAQAASQNAAHAPYDAVWGPPTGPYAIANNPIRTIDNVSKSRVYLSSGTGVPDPTLPYDREAWTTGAVIEAAAFAQNSHYVAVARTLGFTPAFKVRLGVHAWPDWRRALPGAIAWNLFAAPPVLDDASARKWTYKTMAPHGNAWGLGYKFAAPTTSVVTLNRNQQVIIANGVGRVTINPGAPDADASGNGTRPDCSFTATMPFSRSLPAGC
jgi:S-formylglutathione hydrolase FrmB